ncbi:uncharacterized protein LOC127803526 [Diospyros lotus]|uniref:uncharacterized protein LOC127803526 n=1 Tax=Diospyros lotus TaxID=55363 RepID=UPI0022501846|nr:uncharacterized protein LOC127803526 [Diospyros lotus]
MATLQKFKILASQCAIAGSPTRSPTTSPVVHLRRRKTLRMLLSRTASGSSSGRRLPRLEDSPDRQRKNASDSQEKSKALAARHKLKDFLLSSPPLEESDSDNVEEVGEGLSPSTAVSDGATVRHGGQRGIRPLTLSVRQRLLRRAWRPVLVTIPE